VSEVAELLRFLTTLLFIMVVGGIENVNVVFSGLNEIRTANK